MKFHRNKFLTTVAAAALAIAVGACSSSGDDDGITAERDTALESLKAANAKVKTLTDELATANSNLETANTNLETATGRVTELETLIGEEMDPAAESLRGILAQANMDLEQARTDLQMAMDNSADEMEIDRLTKAVTATETMRDSYKGMLDTANLELDGDGTDANEGLRAKVTRLTDELEIANKRAEDAEEELAVFKEENRVAIEKEALAERKAREVGVRAAIVANRVGTAASPFPDPDGFNEQLVKRDAAGKITVDVNGTADDVYAGGETTAGSGDWNSVMLTKTNVDDESTDTVVFYTDIAAPADADFGKIYPSGTNFLAENNVKKARADNFPTGATQRLTYSATSGNPLSFRGTFDDVPGVFTCGVEECTLMTDAKGVLGAATEAWGFTPDAPNSATVKDPDVGYAYFGWWLNKPKANDEMHGVEVFAGGSTGHEADVNNAIVGNATYSGPAAGKYVTKTFSAGVHSDSGVGHFTATANLTAKFRGDGAGHHREIGHSLRAG